MPVPFVRAQSLGRRQILRIPKIFVTTAGPLVLHQGILADELGFLMGVQALYKLKRIGRVLRCIYFF